MLLFYTDISASLGNAQSTKRVPTIDGQLSKETLASYKIIVVPMRKVSSIYTGKRPRFLATVLPLQYVFRERKPPVSDEISAHHPPPGSIGFYLT